MNTDEATRAVIDKLGDQSGETLTPERVEAIQTAMHEDLGRFINSSWQYDRRLYTKPEYSNVER